METIVLIKLDVSNLSQKYDLIWFNWTPTYVLNMIEMLTCLFWLKWLSV
jgi:hypothetical protein